MQPDDAVNNRINTVPEPGASSAAQPSVSNSSIPLVADDADIIETEWIEALQRTIEQHRHDPYALSRALTALRRDYLQKRYGKNIEAIK